MEVLGAVASSLALLEISLKTANFLQGISNIQSDYEDLKLQIVNINAIIKDFQNVPRLFPNIPGLPQLSEPLSMALADQQLQDIKKELDDIATYCADDKRSQAKKAKWILKRNRIATLTQKARDAKSNLQMAMGCQTASLSAIQCIAGHRSHLDVIAALQSLRYIQSTSLPPAPQPTLGEVTDSYIEESQTTTNADISKDSVDDANVNQQDWSGMTPLMVAALYNRVECMRLFLKAGCNIQQDNEGDCAIHYAAQRCSTDAVGLLLAAGASASARGLNGRTPLHLLAVNPASTKTDAIEKTIQLLLVTKDADLEARDINGHTPAMFALCESNLPVLRCLIEAGASLYTNDVYSQNTIHLTAMYAHIEVLEYLLSLDIKVFSGINPESLSTYDLTPWDYFLWTLQGSPFQMGSRRRPSPAEQDAFASLYQALRDQVSRQEIRLLERAVEFLGQGHFDDARAQLSIIIDQKREWEQDDLAGWYRGIEKSIQLGEVESAIEILTDDIEECTTRIGASPWDIENRWGIKGPVVFSSSSEGGDDEEEETIHSEDEDGASESADDAAQASDEDGSETDEETGRIVTVDY
ncbi:hypothetical protein QQX98_011881 [Neonectria punicea]|uniref:NACHT-NTPase and P-loop NTPases N-terminal domain-containing protein n=1 Tax=Neonectria punicea TaxID=979145 RepID=A0ABR1GKI6_9HYPO